MRLIGLLCSVALLGALACAQGSVAKFDDDDDDGAGAAAGHPTTTTTTTPTPTTQTISTATTTSTATNTTTTTSTTSSTTTTTTTTTGGSGGACYAGVANCNPMLATCGAGYACDAVCDEIYGYCWFDCFEPPNDVPVGGACDAGYGPWCVPGALCNNYVCAKYCCTNADCSGGTCTSIGYFETETYEQVELWVCQ